jgi:dihydroorotase-like cyclic amidohydrolase
MSNSQASVADLVISGATVVSDTAAFKASVAISNGSVLAIGDASAMPAAREVLDATGLHLLPGAIDVHVHFREPGYTHKEDWQTGTAAAAMGGVTTVFDMPNVDPPTGTPDALALKQEAAKKAHVDYGIYGLLAEDNVDQLEGLIEGGVAAFKCFMGNTWQSSVALDRGHARGVRNHRATWHANCSPCRDGVDHGMAREEVAGCRAHRSARPFGGAPGGGGG